jgi:surfeit locus 1 family protein
MKAALSSLAALVGVVLLTALGLWQLERREWKLDLIQRVAERVHAAPVAAPGPGEWSTLTRANAEYRRVTVTGQFLNERETLVRAATREGPGFWVLTPLETEQGFTVLVNRGFVPPKERDPARRQAGQITGETRVTGLLRITEPQGGFLHSNEPAANRWYSRDVAAIAAARGLSRTAPYFIDADTTPNAGGLPIGGLTVIAFRNNHLQYALTWFTLALMLTAGMFLILRHAPDRRHD